MCLEFKCTRCEWRKCFYTSKEIKNDNRGAPPYEVNYLSIIAMREIGRGHTSLTVLCGVMNLPTPMNIKAYNDMQEKIALVYKEVANQSAFCKSTSHIPANIPHPTSHIPNIPHPEHPDC